MTTRLSPSDRLLLLGDRLLRRMAATTPASTDSEHQAHPSRPTPTAACAEALDATERALSARLMRVNHAGEVAAQALYQGQAATARDAQIREHMLEAGREERDHLEWCETRLRELEGSRSLLTPFWYAGSLAIGAVAGLSGDRWSLGFVAETERQVEVHLSEHLARLPAKDTRSRAILEQMQADEVRHGAEALDAGGNPLPPPVRGAMQIVAKVMTRTAYWV